MHYRKHLGIVCLAIISLYTEGEKHTALAAEPMFRVGYASEWAPISFGKDEKVTGILPDLIEEIVVKRMGIPVSHQGLPWARAQEALKDGIIDGIITTPTKKRLHYSLRSKSNILNVPFKGFALTGSDAHRNLQENKNISDLKKFRFCDVLGYSWAKAFYKDRNIDYEVTSSLDNCLRMMMVDRVDIIIHASPVAQMFVKNMKLGSRITMLPKTYPESPNFPLLLSKKSLFGSEFLDKFDVTILELKKAGEFDRIVAEITEKNLSKPVFNP